MGESTTLLSNVFNQCTSRLLRGARDERWSEVQRFAAGNRESPAADRRQCETIGEGAAVNSSAARYRLGRPIGGALVERIAMDAKLGTHQGARD